jgi:hypothetical protein
LGTSTSNPGPSGNKPLLPPWAPDVPFEPAEPLPPPEQQPQPDPDLPVEPQVPGMQPPPPLPVRPDIALPVEWRAPKSTLTRVAKGTSSRAALGSAARSYVAAHGGPRKTAASARAGRSTTRGLAGFLQAGIREGFARAAARLGILNLVGRDAQFVLAAFIDMLAPDGSVGDEPAARDAAINTLIELFDRYDVQEEGIGGLDRLDADGMREVILLSITNYVNARFLHELENCIERGSHTEQEANRLANEVKDFISGLVQIDLGNMDVLAIDWNGTEGQMITDRLYQDAYTLLGGTPL